MTAPVRLPAGRPAPAGSVVSGPRVVSQPPAATGPVFLAGADRSGIGLLGEVLEHHPAFAITRRTDWWSRVDGRYGDLSVPDHLEALLDDLAHDRRLRLLTPDRERLRASFHNGSADYLRLFALLQEQRAERLGRPRWGDKSLGSERYADRVLTAFPDARMVHVLRDPRDRYASQRDHRGLGRGGLGAAAAVWRDSARRAVRNLRRHPGRYLVVHYERLARDPVVVLAEVVAFLAEPAATVASTLAAAATGGPGALQARSVGRFRRDLDAGEVAFLEVATRPWADRLGYPATGVAPTGTAAAAFALRDLPVEAAHAAAWAMRGTGRRPPHRPVQGR